jgi:hypothetical protein
MEVFEVVLYFVLTLILLALIGVLSWLIYDYYEYKKAVKSKISETVALSDDNDSLLKREVTTDYDNKFNIHNEHIISTSNILRDEYRRYANNTSNILRDEYRTYANNTSNILRPEYMTKLDNSSSNLNKFFSFGVNNDNSVVNSKIHNRTWDLSDNESLKLMRNTIANNNLTAEKGVKIYTDSGATGTSSKGLELCDKGGANCWNLYVDSGGDLKVAKPNDIAYSLSFTVLGEP